MNDHELSTMLFLTEDRMAILDSAGHTICVKREWNGCDYYHPIAVETEGYEAICSQVMRHKVCTRWDASMHALLWEVVDVCNKVVLMPRGFSNIS